MKKATPKQIIDAMNGDEYEAAALVAIANTFEFWLKQGKSQLYATCHNCGKRLMLHTCGSGSLSERIAEHNCRGRVKQVTLKELGESQERYQEFVSKIRGDQYG